MKSNSKKSQDDNYILTELDKQRLVCIDLFHYNYESGVNESKTAEKLKLPYKRSHSQIGLARIYKENDEDLLLDESRHGASSVSNMGDNNDNDSVALVQDRVVDSMDEDSHSINNKSDIDLPVSDHSHISSDNPDKSATVNVSDVNNAVLTDAAAAISLDTHISSESSQKSRKRKSEAERLWQSVFATSKSSKSDENIGNNYY